ncbi:dehydrogenase/reductase SDR family member 4 isoform X2 [Lampris incognitus]|uniref:dehydrogenase/reductase SDR family member 4 isoform X2 n=1 Tax=Lampris incognitus TaxID=2546036 RepID=UPI0024B5C5C8|nr:dehydrogenase/reductase SDR family member 4 isoform X2 [Lampris incognitus]
MRRRRKRGGRAGGWRARTLFHAQRTRRRRRSPKNVVTDMLRGVFRCLLTNPVTGKRNMSQSSLAGKVAIVTASTDGIGLAAAQALGQRGAHVVVSSRRQVNVDKAVALLQSQSIQVTGTICNVGKSEDREKLVQMTVEQCGGVDILVSNAAVNPFFGNIMDSTEAVWDKILDVNVKSAFLLTKLAVPQMEKRGGGSVVFVSSVAGYQPMQALGPYSVSKTALLGLTRALAPELAHSNIRVNCVAPGVIKTRFSSAAERDRAFQTPSRSEPSRRLGCCDLMTVIR